jgi:ABC-type transporter Mla subunit MlaD
MNDSLDAIRYVDQAIKTVQLSVDDLKTMLDARYADQTKALDAALAAADKALDKAERLIEQRLDALNARLNKLELTQNTSRLTPRIASLKRKRLLPQK